MTARSPVPSATRSAAATATATADFMQKPWMRATTAFYGPFAATVSFLLATLPFSAAVFLAPPLGAVAPIVIAFAGFSIGPAWVAALYTMRRYATDRDLEPFRVYWRGYRLGWRQALLFWAPYFSLLVVLALDLTAGAASTTPVVFWLLVALGAAALLWGGTVLVIVAFFSFRLRDVLRLAMYGLVHTPRWLLAQAALLVAAGGLVYVGSEAAAGLLVAPFALLTVLASRPLVRMLTRGFTQD